MKRNKWLKIFLFLLVLTILISFGPAMADVGGGLDWDSNKWEGGRGFGGGSSNSLFGIDPFFFFYMFSRFPLPFLIIVGIVVVTRIFNIKNNKDANSYKSEDETADQDLFTSQDTGLDELLKLDPDFSEHEFLSRASSVFVALQNAWTEKDPKTLRTFESDQLYFQHKQQLDDYIKRSKTNIVEDLSVLDNRLEKFTKDSRNQYLSCIIKARYKDYVVDDTTGKIIKGRPGDRYIMTYRMVFFRKLDARSGGEYEGKVTQCPNCGANLSIDQNGVCEYCGSQVNAGAYQWLLTELKPLSQIRV